MLAIHNKIWLLPEELMVEIFVSKYNLLCFKTVISPFLFLLALCETLKILPSGLSS